MSVTRETLYEEVWAEPMTKVAARYGMASNLLGRICDRLRVPCPSRGYWAQLKVGKARAGCGGFGVSTTATPGTQIVTGELHRVRRGRGKRFSAEAPPEALRRPAQVALTLALAHMIRRAIDRGEIRHQAEAARRLGVTRARITQILDLTLLAPDVQEKILLLEVADDGVSSSERGIRSAALLSSWIDQRRLIGLSLLPSRGSITRAAR